MENQLWHKASKKEKQEIKKQAKEILDNFSKKLEKIKTKEEHFSQDSGLRKEGDGWEISEDFRQLMFENAPNVENDAIVAEKGGWK